MIKNFIKKYFVYILFLVAGFFLFYKLGDFRLMDVDEPRYAEAAREILVKNDWLTPYFNFELRFDKPIFFYWTIAVSYLLMGVNEFAARFPSALAGLLSVFMTYFFALKTFSKKVAIFSSLILVSMLEFFIIARMSITDMTLSFFISTAIMLGYLGIEANKHNKIYWWLAYIACGGAVLTKGPVGMVLPVAIVGFYMLITGQVKKNLKASYLIPGLMLFFVIALPWYVLMIQKHGSLYINEFFIKHNLERFASKDFAQHESPFWFYIPVLLVGALPWTTYFVAALVKYIKQIYGDLKEKFSSKSLYPFDDVKVKPLLYCLIWFFAIFVFYSISKAKLLTYILPLYPAMAIITGKLWADFKDSYRYIKISTYVLLAICTLIMIGLLVFLNIPASDKLDYLNKPLWMLITGVVFGIIPLIGAYLVKIKKQFSFVAVISFIAMILVVKLYIANPIIYELGQKDFEMFINTALRYNNHKVYACGMEKPSLTFYAKEKIYYANREDITLLKELLSHKTPVFIITKNKFLGELTDLNGFNIQKGRKYALITNIKEVKYE